MALKILLSLPQKILLVNGEPLRSETVQVSSHWLIEARGVAKLPWVLKGVVTYYKICPKGLNREFK